VDANSTTQAEKTSTPIEELYSSIGWPLNKKYGHAVDAFKLVGDLAPRNLIRLQS
jgi:translation initiation factor 2 alpha subunit (eIF-2alpha)